MNGVKTLMKQVKIPMLGNFNRMEPISGIRFENAEDKTKKPVIIDLRNIYNPNELKIWVLNITL